MAIDKPTPDHSTLTYFKKRMTQKNDLAVFEEMLFPGYGRAKIPQYWILFIGESIAKAWQRRLCISAHTPTKVQQFRLCTNTSPGKGIFSTGNITKFILGIPAAVHRKSSKLSSASPFARAKLSCRRLPKIHEKPFPLSFVLPHIHFN